MAGELIDPTKFCDECKHLDLTESKQNEIKAQDGFACDHRCEKYGCQVLHLGMHPKILRAGICLINDGFEA